MFLSALKNTSAWKQHTMCDIHRSVDGVQISLNCTKAIRKTKRSTESDKTRRRGASRGGAGGRKQFGQKTFLRGLEGAGGAAAAARSVTSGPRGHSELAHSSLSFLPFHCSSFVLYYSHNSSTLLNSIWWFAEQPCHPHRKALSWT